MSLCKFSLKTTKKEQKNDEILFYNDNSFPVPEHLILLTNRPKQKTTTICFEKQITVFKWLLLSYKKQAELK